MSRAMRRFLGAGPYVPDIEAHERHDAEVMRRGHPATHQWRVEDDGFTRCAWDGCAASAPSDVSAQNIRGSAVIIVDLLAREDKTREALLAGPFFDEDSLRAALANYLAPGLMPAILVVNPADYEVFRWRSGSVQFVLRRRQEARQLLIELTRQPEYSGMRRSA